MDTTRDPGSGVLEQLSLLGLRDRRNALLHTLEWVTLLCALGLSLTAYRFHPLLWAGFALLLASGIGRYLRLGRWTVRTPVDLPLVLFLLSAVMATAIAPDQSAALARLFLFLTTASLYYALVNSTKYIRLFLSVAFPVGAAIIGILAAAQYDWVDMPLRFSSVAVIGRWLNNWIPDLGLQGEWNVTRNLIASLLALAAPFAAWLVWQSVSRIRNGDSSGWTRLLGSILAASLLVVGLFLSESRTPWIVSVLLAGIAGVVWLGMRRSWVAAVGVVVLSLVLVLMVPEDLLQRLPGPQNNMGRLEIYSQSWELSQEKLFTGGGLGSFPALYSTYIQRVPYNRFLDEDTGNSAYLTILVEQGMPGLLAYLGLLGAATAASLRAFVRAEGERRGLIGAALFAIGYIWLQGFLHATLVSTRAAVFLFLPLGFALSGWHEGEDVKGSLKPKWLAAAALLLVGSTLVGWRTLASSAYANIGTLQMDAVLLLGFPHGEWERHFPSEQVAPALLHFQRSLAFDPANTTSNYRIGHIALLSGNFYLAVSHLESAFQEDLDHRGVRKALGLAYVWNGNITEGAALLKMIPEAVEELDVYTWWWNTQGRSDLSSYAERALGLLNE